MRLIVPLEAARNCAPQVWGPFPKTARAVEGRSSHLLTGTSRQVWGQFPKTARAVEGKVLTPLTGTFKAALNSGEIQTLFQTTYTARRSARHWVLRVDCTRVSGRVKPTQQKLRPGSQPRRAPTSMEARSDKDRAVPERVKAVST